MPGLAELLKESKTTLKIIQIPYTFTCANQLVLEDEPYDGPPLFRGDCFFKQQDNGQYALTFITNNDASSKKYLPQLKHYLPLLAQITNEEKGIVFADSVEFIQEPFKHWVHSSAELSLLINPPDTEMEDLDSEACAPDNQVNSKGKQPHNIPTSSYGFFNQPSMDKSNEAKHSPSLGSG